MKKTERVRQVVSGPLGVADLKQQTEKGWKLVAIEWEREIDAAEDQLPADVPFGLQMALETQRLEENPVEREMLFLLMELIVQEGSYARIADEINRRGFRSRQGAEWSPVSVFEMLPRLIEVGPHVFQPDKLGFSAFPTLGRSSVFPLTCPPCWRLCTMQPFDGRQSLVTHPGSTGMTTF